jgi:hypothetical protein
LNAASAFMLFLAQLAHWAMPMITEVAASLPAPISPAQMTMVRSNLPPATMMHETTIEAGLLYLYERSSSDKPELVYIDEEFLRRGHRLH